MNTNRNIAIVIGVLFILTEITSIAGLFLYGPILNDPNYIVKASVSETRVLWGAFLEIILVFTQIGTAVVLFPILRKQNETVAVGTVVFRLMEAMIVTVGIISLMSIVTLNHSFLNNADPDVSSYLIAGRLLVDIHNWTFLYGPNIFLGTSSFMTGYLLYKGKLVPRLVSFLGMVGGPLIAISAVMVMFGVFPQLSILGFMLALPVFAYEVSLALWLIIKGFITKPATRAPLQNLYQLAGQV